MNKSSLYILSLAFIFTSCGGGGGGGSEPSAPAPQNITVSLTSSADSAEVNSSITLTWSSALATSCSASGAWSGSKGTSGSESITIGVGGSNTFSLSCSATGANSGSASTSVNGLRYFDGKVFDGYIRGAEVFVDTNDNLTLDANEASVTTDNQGGFTKLLYDNGTLVSMGGIDSDTGADLSKLTLVHKLEGYEASKLASPFTTLIAYMGDASNINAALGIDASINLLSTDPIPNLGERIYDQMYEKGNQLTVIALTLQNYSDDSTSQIYFQAIANELEKSYSSQESSVNIEDKNFISNVIDEVETLSSNTFNLDAKRNLNTIISSVVPFLEVKNDQSITTSIQRFAFSTLQDDVRNTEIMLGSASSTIGKYTNQPGQYIADDQGIVATDINNPPSDLMSATDCTGSLFYAPPIGGAQINFTADENQTSIPGCVFTSDADGDPLIYSISGSEINISNTGVLSFISAPDYETKNSYDATVTVSDSKSSKTATLRVLINDIDESPTNNVPTISSAATFSAAENQTSIGGISASDADGDSLTYSISGSEISISGGGTLTFVSAPDYETKNSYTATVTVSDGNDSVSQSITVNVTDVYETSSNNPPYSMLTAPGVWQFDVYENKFEIGLVTFNDDDGDVLTYSISGSEINISSDGGLLTFVSAPDFEVKNLYTATVTASDGTASASAEVEIHILNVNEAPIAQPQPRVMVLENSTEVVFRANSLDPDNGINALDPDGPPDLLNFSLSGQDASKLSIDSNGDVRFEESSNFECPEDEGLNNIYDFNVVVTDSFGLSAESDSSIQVSNIASPAQVGDSLFAGSDSFFGFSVSISGDGSIIAVHTGNNGSSNSSARVYQNIDGSWTQLGNTLSGELGFIALSENGLILATGNKVFEYSSGTWQQLGTDIPSGGISQVALSADGLTLAIGGSSNFAKVFKYTQDQWVQLGSTLEGETIDGNGIGFGSSVSLNNDGNVLAVSAPGNNTSIDGLTRIYSLSNNEWIQLGSDINGEQPIDDSGTSISLNGTGSIIAIGASNNTANSVGSWGHVRVFEYKDGSWQQMGGDIDGKSSGSASGTSVSINDDGNIVAIGAPGQKSCNLNRSGQVRVFKLISGEWIQLGDDIDGPSSESGLGWKHTISFDNAGNTLIVSAYAHENENGANSGLVKVYEFNE